jgi:hypothetical protein
MLFADLLRDGQLAAWLATGIGIAWAVLAVFLWVHPLKRRSNVAYPPVFCAVFAVGFLVPGVVSLIWHSRATTAAVWLPVEIPVITALVTLAGLQVWRSLPPRGS